MCIDGHICNFEDVDLDSVHLQASIHILETETIPSFLLALMHSHAAEVAQFPVVSLSPGEHLAVHRQRQGMATSRVHSDLLDDILAEGGQLTGLGHVARTDAQPQAAIGGLSTGVQLAVLSHCVQETATVKF